MYWAVVLLINLAASFLITALTKKSGPKAAQPQKPRAREGDPIPIIFGRQKVPAFVFYWEPGSPLPYTRSGTVMHYYYYALHAAGFCRGPVDKIVDVIFDETKLLSEAVRKATDGHDFPICDPPVGPATPVLRSDHPDGVQLRVFAPFLFGGGAPAGSGGVIGDMDFYWGTTTQTANSTLTSWMGRTPPGYRGLAYAVLHNGIVFQGVDPFIAPLAGFYVGDDPTQKSMYFVLQRNPSGLLGPDTAEVGDDGDANAAEAIWEIITDTTWGLAQDPADYDRASFEAAALVLFDEQLGVSFTIDSDTTAGEKIQDILKHIDGELYRDPTTGLIALRLYRADYSDAPGEILELEEGENCTDVEVSRALPSEIVSSIKVNYTSASQGYSTRGEDVQNAAAYMLIGGRKITDSVDLPFLTNATNAHKAGQRLLRAKTLELRKVSLKATRSAYPLAKGSPFAVRAPSKGLDRAIFRVVDLDQGRLEDGEIAIDGVEDVFSIAGALTRPSTGSQAPAVPAPGSTANHLIITPSQSQTAGVGTLTITIDDPDGVVTEVAFQVRAGGVAGAGYVADAAAPYEATVNLVDGVPSYIDYRVTYDLPNGSSTTQSGTATFSAAIRPSAPRLSVEYDGSGNATIDSRGDSLTATHRIAYSTSSYPTDATTRAAPVQTGQNVSTTGGTVAEGGTLYVAAFAYDASGNESLKAIGAFPRSGSAAATPAAIGFEFGDGITAPPANAIAGGRIPFACTITEADIWADASGSAVVDIQKSTDGVSWASIAASAKPTLSSSQSVQDTTLTGWTTAIAAGTWIRAVLNSVTTCKQVTVQLKLVKS